MSKPVIVPIKESTCIAYAKYHVAARKLLVKFQESSHRYIYNDVDLELLKAWVKHGNNGGSIGSFFITNIKAKHTFARVGSEVTEDSVETEVEKEKRLLDEAFEEMKLEDMAV